MYMIVRCGYFILFAFSPQKVQNGHVARCRRQLACSRPPQRRCNRSVRTCTSPALQRLEHTAPTMLPFSGFAASASAALAPPRQPPRSHSIVTSFEGPSPNTLTLPPSLGAGRGKGGGRGGGGEAVEARTSPTSPIPPPPAPPSTYRAPPLPPLSHHQWTAMDAAAARVAKAPPL
jgi:hypothetical protein